MAKYSPEKLYQRYLLHDKHKSQIDKQLMRLRHSNDRKIASAAELALYEITKLEHQRAYEIVRLNEKFCHQTRWQQFVSSIRYHFRIH